MGLVLNLLIFHVVVMVVFFATNFALMRTTTQNHFSQNAPNDTVSQVINAFYYTVTTHTTVGFGDMTPRSTIAKFATGLHQLMVFIVTAGVFAFGQSSPEVVEVDLPMDSASPITPTPSLPGTFVAQAVPIMTTPVPAV